MSNDTHRHVPLEVNQERRKPHPMRRTPVNIAFSKELIKRVRVVAAHRDTTPSDLVNKLVEDGLPEMELQIEADRNARVWEMINEG